MGHFAKLHRDPWAQMADVLRVLLARLANFLRDFLTQLVGHRTWLLNTVTSLLVWLADGRDCWAWLAGFLSNF